MRIRLTVIGYVLMHRYFAKAFSSQPSSCVGCSSDNRYRVPIKPSMTSENVPTATPKAVAQDMFGPPDI